ncbi:MAG: DsbA family protein [Candidatus Levybacteria bacterium]|nr:DsbA family protein [Candidatus Levybacteria bacterium]
MAARKTTLKKSPETDPKDYVQIKLPKFLPKIGWSSLVFIAILLLLGGLVGYQTAKVTYWEQKEELLSAGTLGQIPTPTPGIFKVGNGHLPVLGKSSAKITIVEFSDFQCLFCRKFWKDTLPQIKKDYIDTGLVKFAFRQYPLPPEMHPAARDLAEASECANEQNKFWEFHDKAFAEQELKGEGTIAVTTEDISLWAGQLGLNLEQFNSCFSSKKYASKIDQDMADGAKISVSSTPTSFVNGQIVVGALPYASFKTIIDQQLKK